MVWELVIVSMNGYSNVYKDPLLDRNGLIKQDLVCSHLQYSFPGSPFIKGGGHDFVLPLCARSSVDRDPTIGDILIDLKIITVHSLLEHLSLVLIPYPACGAFLLLFW